MDLINSTLSLCVESSSNLESRAQAWADELGIEPEKSKSKLKVKLRQKKEMPYLSLQ